MREQMPVKVEPNHMHTLKQTPFIKAKNYILAIIRIFTILLYG